MRRLILLASVLLVAGCVDVDFDDLKDLEIKTVQNKPYNTIWFVVPLALTTPPVNTIVFGPCHDEFGMPDHRRANCELYYKTRRRTPPWQVTAAQSEAMKYDAGELQCWRTLGTSECVVVSGPPRPVYMIAPNMGSN